MSRGIFITGTDTGVGKTIVSAAIIRALIKKGINTGAMKSVESGCIKKNDVLIPQDGMFLKKIADMDDSIDLITPMRFEHPLSPMVASDLEKMPVALDKIFIAYKRLSEKYEFMVVEGAGGILVPIKKERKSGRAEDQKFKKHPVYFMSDLIKDLKLPVIIVARPSLGTINHTLLTVNQAMREGIEVLGVIINHSSPPENSIAEKTNPEALKELCPVPVIWEAPFVCDVSAERIDDIMVSDRLIDIICRYGQA
jgi:dethiobiotin synthetase